MRLLPLALLAGVAVLAGCTSTDVSSQSLVTCTNDVCEVCVDGACAPCSGAECDECVRAGGDCAAMRRAAAPAEPASFPDLDVQESHDLLDGFPETTWDFDVARGATGHVRLAISDPVAQQATLMASACFRYTITGTWGSSSVDEGNGNCSGSTIGVSGSTASGPKVMADWDSLQPGHYTLTLEAPRQPNQLSIDIHVDNP